MPLKITIDPNLSHLKPWTEEEMIAYGKKVQELWECVMKKKTGKDGS